jgi:pyruvate/2-oxoacid:ferredoxin oxidoreductase alpha subunit
MDDADVALVGYGIVARVLRSAVDLARARGVRAGLLRPLTLWPFPAAAILDAARLVEQFVVVELSEGQMIDDVRLALEGRRPVAFHGRRGGNVPTPEEVLEHVHRARVS